MSLKIVLGGTTGAADGTLVDGSHPIVFTGIDVPIDAHIRADDDTYAAPSQFIAATTAGPAVGKGDIQVSVDGGSVWHGWSDNPLSLATGVGLGSVDLGDLNFPIKLRQHAASPPGDTSGGFDTDGTLASATALGDVTGFTVTPGNTQNTVSWSAVTNRTRYQVDRATNSGFTTGVSLGVYTGTGTSFTDTGLTNGTTYYYRIKAVGTYRFKDSANFATGNAQTGLTTGTYSPSADAGVRSYHADGTSWATTRADSVGDLASPTQDYSGGPLSNNPASTDRNIARFHIHFDTSAIPDGATIIAARLKLWGHETFTKAAYNTATALVLCDSLMTAGAVAATSDYPNSKFGTTELTNTRMAHSAWSDGAYNVITLNAAGLAAINKTGTTRLALREATDFDNSAPSAGSTIRALQFYTQEFATSGKRPVLEVDYA